MTTQKSTYKQEIVSEINDTEEITEATFPINLKLTAKDQRTEPRLIAKYKGGMHQKGYFHGGSNIDLNLITCEDKIVIPSILKNMYYIGNIPISFI